MSKDKQTLAYSVASRWYLSPVIVSLLVIDVSELVADKVDTLSLGISFEGD